MRRTHSLVQVITLLVLFAAPSVAVSQFRAPRSADYLFVALDSDAPMLWVNPAALGVEFNASIMGEAWIARDANDDFSLAQFSAGFASRGFGFGYRRDRFDDSTAGNTYRLGFGRGLTRLAVGVSATLYSDSADQREVEVGIRYILMRGLEVAAVLQHIGKPNVRGVRLPFTGVGGIAWSPFGPAMNLVAEAAAADRITSGYDLSYRGGLRLAMSGQLPIRISAALDLSDDFKIDRLILALRVGGPDRGVLVADGARRMGSNVVNGFSLAGIASRPLSSR